MVVSNNLENLGKKKLISTNLVSKQFLKDLPWINELLKTSEEIKDNVQSLLLLPETEDEFFDIMFEFERQNPSIINNHSMLFIGLGKKIFPNIPYKIILKLYEGYKLKIENIELKQENEELKQNKVNLADFCARTSHEINNPLQIILGTSQLMSLDINDENLLRQLNIINCESLRANNLVGDLNNVWSVLDTNNLIKIEKKDVNFNDFIKKIILGQKNFIKSVKKDIKINIDISGDTIISIDIHHFEGVIKNLLNNSIKFINKKGNINISGKIINNMFILNIIDDGNGIKPHHLKTVFGYREQSGTQEDKNKGSGIGLSYVQKIVELHGGEINASSEGVGTGATFKIEIPIN